MHTHTFTNCLGAHLCMQETSLYGMRMLASDSALGTKYMDLLQTFRCPATLRSELVKPAAPRVQAELGTGAQHVVGRTSDRVHDAGDSCSL